MLQLLLAVGGSPTPLSLTEAAAVVGLVPSTALRQLRSLEAAGLLERDDDDQLYRAGPQLVELARTVFVGRSLASAAQPFLDQLAAVTGESVYLAVGEGARRAAYVATAPGQHALRHSGWLGRTFPTVSTAVGAALAGRVDGDGVIARENTLEAGITAVSSPVRINAEIVAAITLVGPTFRLDGETLTSVRSAVADGAAQLSDSLGTTSLGDRPMR
ncbi:MAG: Transcriptional regulator, IclR family [Ilumatobacteraceae bacterium]|nr:Transcriptional regulator, IclR family [Ilumatobacteraceae bacterium]